MHAAGEGVAAGAPQRLAVDGDVPEAGDRVAPLGQPAAEALGKHLGVERAEDAIDGVVTGNAVGQFQESFQPSLATLRKGMDGLETGGPADQADDGDEEDVIDAVFSGAMDAGVGEGAGGGRAAVSSGSVRGITAVYGVS